MRRTEKYAAVTKDEAERRRWAFYEAVKIQNEKVEPLSLKSCYGHREVPE